MNRSAVRQTVLTVFAALFAALLAALAWPVHAAADKPVIGLSIDDLRVERWTRDRDYFVAAAERLGAEVNVQSADGDTAKQIAQIENLISRKVDVLVIVPKDQATLGNVIREAKKSGIKIVSYDRPIKSRQVDAHISFDNERVGFLQGEALLKAAPKGNYYLLAGDPGDDNARWLRSGALKALAPAIARGDVKVVGEQSVKDWLPSHALSIAENVLTQHRNRIDAFVAPNDGTAGAVIQALAAQKLAGKVAVSGQDAELSACKRVVAGTQTMTVYKPLRLIASEAARMAIALARGEPLSGITDTVDGVKRRLLDPIVLTPHNLSILIEDGFFTPEQLGLK